MTERNLLKEKISVFALQHIEKNYNGLKCIGLGSGNTIKYFIERIPESSLSELDFVSSSTDTTLYCNTLGIKILDILASDTLIDLYIDGADSLFADQQVCIKGRGGAMLREKVLAYAAKEFFLLIESHKFEKKVKIPIEVLPFALNFVFDELKKYHMNPIIRTAEGKLGPIVSDNNNYIIDIMPEDYYYDKLYELDRKLIGIPGIVCTGIFKREFKVVSDIENEIKLFEV